MTTTPTTVQERFTLPPQAYAGAPDTGPAITVGDVLTMLRRRMVLIIVLFVLFGGMAIGGFALWWTKFPGYTSEALIECISNVPRAQLTPEQERLRQDEYERFVQTQARLIKSPTILEEVLKLTAVRETRWWRDIQNRQWKRPEEHLIALTEQLQAAPMRGTNFLRVWMECRHPEDPKVIVGAVVNQWHDVVKRRTAEEFADQALDAAQDERDQLDLEIQNKRRRLAQIAQRLPAGAREDPGRSYLALQVAQYAEQKSVLELELAQLDQFRAVYNNPEGIAVTPEDRAFVEADPQVAELTRANFLLRQQRAADAAVYGPGHRVLRELDAQIEASEERLRELRQQKLRERRDEMREAVNTAYENTRHALLLTQENLARAEASLQDQDQLLLEYQMLDQDVQEQLEYRRELEEYIKSLQRVKAQRTAINVTIAQQPTDPLEKSSPGLLMLPLGVFVAMLLAVGIGLTLELIDNSVRTSQDVTRNLDVPLLGLIPDTDDEEVPIDRVETAVRDAPRSAVAEAVRRIRTSLQFSAPADRQRTVIVTGPNPEDGTTTVACNLALAVAQGGRRVLLVDANLRRPGLHRFFKDLPARGLSNLLIGDGDLSSLAVQSGVPMLDVLPSGPTAPNPAELMGSEHFRALLREAAARYDQIILDTPPILLASDALVASAAVDGTILVLRAKRNSRGVARRACSLLHDVGAHVFGAVLNAAQVTRGGYFREQLRAYYEYQSEADAADLARRE